jgi:hypothetical protein
LEQHKADTARFLAFGIVILLGIAYLAHFITTCVLIGMDKLDARALKEVSSSWLPVLAGLASSAATYYFTKER